MCVSCSTISARSVTSKGLSKLDNFLTSNRIGWDGQGPRPLSNHPLYSSNTKIDIILSGIGLGFILHFGLYTNAAPMKIRALLIE